MAQIVPIMRTMSKKQLQRLAANVVTLAAVAVKAALLAAVVCAPLMTINKVQAGTGSIIESTLQTSSGAGFVLMVSLQRAR